MHIFDKFEYLCDLKGVTKATAYKAMGINKATISLWQTARDKGEPVVPSTKNAIKLSEYFGYPTDYFLCGNEFSEQREKRPVDDETLSKAKLELIEKIKKMDDSMVDSINDLADRVLALQDK